MNKTWLMAGGALALALVLLKGMKTQADAGVVIPDPLTSPAPPAEGVAGYDGGGLLGMHNWTPLGRSYAGGGLLGLQR